MLEENLSPPRRVGFDLAALWFRRRSRERLIQIVIAVLVLGALALLLRNAGESLARANLSLSVDFLRREAGFDVGQSLIDYTPSDSFGRALMVGLANTFLVAGLAIVFATLVGLAVGIGALQSNAALSRVCRTYVTLFRNIPLLLQLYLWYGLFTTALPDPAHAWVIGGAAITRVGIILPALAIEASGWSVAAAIAAAAGAGALVCGKRGFRAGVLILALCTAGGAALLVLGLSGAIAVETPVWQRFRFVGGFGLTPEFLALLTGLSLYSASYIAEIVRAGILAVGRGQVEAAQSLGLTRRQILLLVVLPQAVRLITPPLTTQYLNLVKNSSLAVAIGYPDLTSVANTTLNITGRAVECIAIIMAVYLALSLLISAAMAVYRRSARTE